MHFLSESESPLIEILKVRFPECSNRTLKQWISFGRVLVDENKVLKPHAPILPGQKISVTSKPALGPLPIIYQDRWMVVIDKPNGLLSVPNENSDISALEVLKSQFGTSIYAVHRLDQETSGALLFARGRASEKKFDELFEKHSLLRMYAAICEGRFPQDKGTWEHYLKELENYDVVLSSPEEGKEAITHFEVVRRSNKFTYMYFTLETGRKHQIRVQSSSFGHPVIGDFRYGATLDPIKRLGLHAILLEFVHPFTGKNMSFSAQLPKGFKTLGFPDAQIKSS